MEIVKYKKNQVIINEGAIADDMFEIVFGQVGIYLDYGLETQKEISILGEGDFVGELELIDSSTRIASAVALTDNVTVKKFTMDDFNLFVRENPGKVILMIQQLSGRVRSLDNHYYDACTLIDEFRKAAEENVPANPELVAKSRRFSAAARKRR